LRKEGNRTDAHRFRAVTAAGEAKTKNPALEKPSGTGQPKREVEGWRTRQINAAMDVKPTRISRRIRYSTQ
jgi:hypothetical protein